MSDTLQEWEDQFTTATGECGNADCVCHELARGSESVCACDHTRSDHVLSTGPRDTCAGTTERGTPCGCPRYTLWKPATSEHQPAARGGGESERFGFVVFTGRHKILDYHKPDGQQIATADDEDSARLIVRALNTANQHQSPLVAERELLRQLLWKAMSPTHCYCAVLGSEKCWQCEVRAVLMTAEQRSTSE